MSQSGPPVEAHVYCKEYRGVTEEREMDIIVTSPSNGVTKIEFDLSQVGANLPIFHTFFSRRFRRKSKL